ncbi:hypothetical protein [Aeromonas veronii]|uniref:hypothetical protein n=1 Tax=Aeromonas veronii TaxID=654 RepID=UPI0011C361CD|nr:hypothetical protein [Aeromonas veronii]
MSSGRDDFTEKTKKILQHRVGSRCSNPDCRCLTSGPNNNPEKATSIGVAAHITAAAENGPRYDEDLTQEERRSIFNGIWLCQNHAKLIDTDPKIYTVNLLQRWKAHSEELSRLELEGRELQPEQQYEGYFCPHCDTFSKKCVSVCLGCDADIYYGSTPVAWRQDVQTGMTTSILLCLVFFMLLPQWIDDFLGWKIPFFWGGNVIVVLFCCAVFTIFCSIFYAKRRDRARQEQPPIFVRKRH